MASPQQQPIEPSAASGFMTLFGGVSAMSRKAQAIAVEFAKMSEETFGVGAKAAERMRGAQSLQDVAAIQSDMLKESYQTTTHHYRRIAELAMFAPQDLAQSAKAFGADLAEAGQQGAARASDLARKTGGQAAAAAETSGEAAESAIRGEHGG
jgi:hypothetical protein